MSLSPEQHDDYLKVLLDSGYKCVISQGGFRSNKAKIAAVERVANHIGQTIPSVEMSTKPLNPKQIQDMYARICPDPEKSRLAADQINRLVVISEKIPIPFTFGVELLKVIDRGEEVTEERVFKMLNDPQSGAAQYKISELKEHVV
ncbi:MAG TPA: hypothetical protein PK263_03545 [bacterium]|nr:hypothetical protein [bacterium]